MKRVLLATALVALSTGVASAGGFVGLGIGTSPVLGSERDDLDTTGRSFRLLAGYRFGRISVEGSVTAFDMAFINPPDAIATKQWAIAGKYNFPLQDGFEVFGRFGLQHTSLDQENNDFEMSGNGWLLGAGFEYNLRIVTFFVDFQYARAEVEGTALPFDVNTRSWTAGATLRF